MPLLGAKPARARAGGPWRFDVFRDLTWRLSRPGEVAVDGAGVAVQIDGVTTPLTRLDALRRYHGGGRHLSVWVVSGRAGDVEVTAEFVDGDAPTVTLRVRGLGARRAVGDLFFFDTRVAGSVPALRGAHAWINGETSADDCAVVDAGTSDETVGFWQLALLTAGDRGLGLSFGETDTGAGLFVVEKGRLAAIGRCAGRAVAAELPPASCRLTLLPGPDPLAALGRTAGYGAPRLPADVPSGWRLGAGGGDAAAFAEADVTAALDFARRTFDKTALRVIQVGPGYQRAVGDWDANERFPTGHNGMAQAIRNAGFTPGLWLAPFAVADHSSVAREHQDWLLVDENGAVFSTGSLPGGERLYALDAEVDDAREHLRQLTRTAVLDWGYQLVELDRVGDAAMGPRTGRRWSPSEAYRAGMEALRTGATGAFVLAAGAPLQHTLGTVDGVRMARATAAATLAELEPNVHDTLLRAHLARRAWDHDAGALAVQDTLALDEARLLATAVALTGGVAITSGALAALPAERLDILQRVMPVLPVTGELLDVAADAPGAGPMLVLASAGTDRWQLAALNFTDEAKHVTANLAAQGVRGPFATFDVWAETRLNDVSGTAVLVVPPRAAVCLALRRPRIGAPYVLGTSRHVVQGLLDLQDEKWDNRHRVLSGTSVALDARPYAITIAVPPGWHPKSCHAGVACSIEHPHGTGAGGARQARLSFDEAAERIDWEVQW